MATRLWLKSASSPSLPPDRLGLCNGQLMPISQNTALFALLGTVYGGDGKSPFSPARPARLRARPPRTGQGFSRLYDLGQMAAAESVTLARLENLSTRTIMGRPRRRQREQPRGPRACQRHRHVRPARRPQPDCSPDAVAGRGQPPANTDPYLTLNFCIALQGVFPASRKKRAPTAGRAAKARPPRL